MVGNSEEATMTHMRNYSQVFGSCQPEIAVPEDSSLPERVRCFAKSFGEMKRQTK